MCLIIGCPKGTDKKSKFLLDAITSAAITNTDGVGYSYKRDGADKIFISKGYSTAAQAIKSIKNKRLKEEDELVIHLRIGNRGAKSVAMMHPFVVSDVKEEIVTEEGYVKKPTLAHNGTFHQFSVVNSEFSDTFFFIKDFFSTPELVQLVQRDKLKFTRLFSTTLSTNRLCVLFPESDMLTIGSFEQEEGYYFSNSSYKYNNYRNVGGVDQWDADRSSQNCRVSNLLNKTKQADYDLKQLELQMSSELKNVDARFDVIPAISIDFITEPKFKLKQYRYLGFYLPIKYPTTQYQTSRPVVNETNYSHFYYKFKDESTARTFGSTSDEFYWLSDWDHDRGVHTFSRAGQTESLCIANHTAVYLSDEEILSDFNLIQTTRGIDIYRDVYMLHRRIGASRNQFKRLEKWLNRSFSNADKIIYRGQEYSSLLPLKIFFNYLAIELYPDVYKKYIFEETLDAISFAPRVSTPSRSELFVN